MKFREDEIIKLAFEHITSTYKQHYAKDDTQDQILDYIIRICGSTDFIKGNIIKYIGRAGKKTGEEKKDLLKAIHYTVLLYYFTHLKDEQDKEEPKSS